MGTSNRPFQDSVNALFWVAMIMLVVEMMFALLLNQVLVALVFGAGQEYSDADQTLLFESCKQFVVCRFGQNVAFVVCLSFAASMLRLRLIKPS